MMIINSKRLHFYLGQVDIRVNIWDTMWEELYLLIEIDVNYVEVPSEGNAYKEVWNIIILDHW